MSEMKVHCKYDELADISALRPHPKNPNSHPPDQLRRLAQILEYQGFRYPIKVSKASGFVTSGHGRVEAAKLNGWDVVPVNYQEYESVEQEYADIVADNSIAAWSELDLSAITACVPDLGEGFNLDLLGLQEPLVLPTDSGDPDECPPIPTSAHTRLGELWHLGDHRLLIGDCTVKENVERLMNGEKADMVFTDPPYGIAYDDTKHKHQNGFKASRFGMIEGDDKQFTFPEIDIEEQFWFGANYYCQQLPLGGSWFVWDKKTEAMQGNGMLFTNDFEICWSKKKHKSVMVRKVWAGAINKEPGEARHHPTQKPVSLCEYFISGFSKSSVLDLYLGSGSTLIACEKTGRKCYGTEIDTHYCDVIIQRWEKFSGKTAYLMEGADGKLLSAPVSYAEISSTR